MRPEERESKDGARRGRAKCSHCGREIPPDRGWYQYGAEIMCPECHDEKGGSLTH